MCFRQHLNETMLFIKYIIWYQYLKNVNGSILINVVTVYSKVQCINIKLQWTIFINPG